jgi:DNA-binding NarL/FixJ family response regulator
VSSRIDEPLAGEARSPRLTLIDGDGRTDPVPERTRVLVAHDQALARAGLRALLEGTGAATVIGEAAAGDDLVARAARLRPAVALLDVALPGIGCVEATRRLCAETEVAVVVVYAAETDGRLCDALCAGARGLVLADASPAELVQAVERVGRGEVQVPLRFVPRLIAELAARPRPGCRGGDLLGELTAREREVLTLVARGLGTDEIAERLVVATHTAKTHVNRAMAKLGARSRAQLVVFAYEAGLVVPGTADPHAAYDQSVRLPRTQ